MQENRIRNIRQSRQLSQTALARMVGIPEPTMSAIENGRVCCYPKWRRSIANVLNVREDDLFVNEDADAAGAR